MCGAFSFFPLFPIFLHLAERNEGHSLRFSAKMIHTYEGFSKEHIGKKMIGRDENFFCQARQ